MEVKRPGRPTENPKIRAVQAKLDEDTSEILERYCEENEVNNSQAIRTAIRRLAEDLKEW